MTIKCICGDSECKTKIELNDAPDILWFTDKNGKATLMRLDPNAICDLIQDLKNNYLRMLGAK